MKIEFKNKVLERYIRKKIGKTDLALEITKEDLKRIKSFYEFEDEQEMWEHILTCDFENVKIANNDDFSDIGKLTSLEILDLAIAYDQLIHGVFAFSDIKFLSKLTKLKDLRIRVTQDCDLTPICSLQELQSLGIYDSDISYDKIEQLSSLKNLNELHLENLALTDLDVFNFFKGLNKLTLLNCHLGDDNTEINNVTSLNLCYCKMDNLKFLKQFTALEELKINDCEVSSYSDLGLINKLHKLTLDEIKTKELEFVGKLINLKSLDVKIIEGCLSDFEMINNLVNLEELRIIYMVTEEKQSKLDIFTQFTKLKKFSLTAWNYTVDLLCFIKCQNLSGLYLNCKNVENVRALESLSNLCELKIWEAFSDLKEIQNLKNLKVLNINTDEKDLTLLSDLVELEELQVEYSKRESAEVDLTFLNNMHKLEKLEFRKYTAKDIDPLLKLFNADDIQVKDGEITWGNGKRVCESSE